MSLTYPHCQHCCWNNEHHVDVHDTPCWTGCAGASPVDQAALW